MAQRPTTPRGMRDFLPQQVQLRQHLASQIRDVYQSHGFLEVETPALEDLKHLQSGQGGDNEKLIFKTLRRGLKAETLTPSQYNTLCDFGLRFDLTVPLTRYYATNQAQLPAPFRAIQMGPVWRAERPQKGRYRQFVQCDIDIIGDGSVGAEISLISATLDALTRCGLSEVTVRMNHRQLLTALVKSCGFHDDVSSSVLVSVDKMDKIGLSGVREELVSRYDQDAVDQLCSLLDKSTKLDPTDFNAIKDLIPAENAQQWIDELSQIATAVRGQSPQNIQLTYDLTLVRGMGYYTGPIFEVIHPDFSGSIAGGGRYDQMIGRLLKQEIPACGFSIGFERLCLILEERGVHLSTDRLALLYRITDDLSAVFSEARELRNQGYQVEPWCLPKKTKGLNKRLLNSGFTAYKRATKDEPIKRLDEVN